MILFFANIKKKANSIQKTSSFFAYCVIGIAVRGGVCYIWGIYSF